MDKNKERGMNIIMLNSGEDFKKFNKLCSNLSIERYELIMEELNWKYPYFDVINWMKKNK